MLVTTFSLMIISSIALLTAAGAGVGYSHYGSPNCMVSSGQHQWESVTLLPDALRRASWSPPSSNGVPSRVKMVMLSSCDHHCLIALFPLFLSFLSKPLDDRPSLTKHLVLAAMGDEAYSICRGHSLSQGNQCLLDLTIENQTCWPKPPSDVQVHNGDSETGQMGFKKIKYYIALLQKIRWSVLCLHLGYSIVWLDIDVTLYRSPFEFFFSLPEETDFAIMSELWTPGSEFKGTTCLVGNRSQGCKEGRQGAEADTDSNYCCDVSPNGGLWMARSNPGGIQLLESWLALYYIHGVTGEKKAFGPEAPLDQDTLLDVIRNRDHYQTHPIPLYRYSGGSYSEAGRLNCSLPMVVRIISGYVCTSHCWTGGNERPCGLYRNTQFGEGCRNPGTYEPEVNHLTCKLPPGHYERLLAYHHTCLHGLHLKQLLMSKRTNISWVTV